jgi:Na+-driven multidrug efflux pump
VLTNFQGSSMMIPALRYLTLRALGAPAVLLSLAMQGVFRGFKDTKTPLYATGKTKATILESLKHQTNVVDS